MYSQLQQHFFKYSIDGTHYLLIQFSWCCNAYANCNDVGHTGSLSKVWLMWYSKMDMAKVSLVSVILNRLIPFLDKVSRLVILHSIKSLLFNDSVLLIKDMVMLWHYRKSLRSRIMWMVRFFMLNDFLLIAIHSMQGWTATTRLGVTRKRSTQWLKPTVNLFKRNPHIKDVR